MTKKTIGIVLVVISIALGIYGINEFNGSQAGIEIGDLELSATDEGSRSVAIMYLVLALVGFVGGMSIIRRS